jgi:D-galacturonate reductase
MQSLFSARPSLNATDQIHHSGQYFHYLTPKGEIRINQAKRAYEFTDDTAGGIKWINPFYMKYGPDDDGNFAGQTGYGYVSFETFIDCCTALNEGRTTLDALDKKSLPTISNTIATTAILNAGRKSIDEGREIEIECKDGKWRLI